MSLSCHRLAANVTTLNAAANGQYGYGRIEAVELSVCYWSAISRQVREVVE